MNGTCFRTTPFRACIYLIAALLLLPTTQAFYDEVYELEEQAATALIESGMYDYAEDQIKHLKVAFRNRAEEINLVEAQLMMKQRRREQALKILDQVPKDSELYPKALLVKISAMSDAAEKADAYKLYFSSIEKPTSEIEQRLYRQNVMRYVALLVEANRTTEAEKALELLKNVGDADSEQLQRRIALMRGQIKLSRADEMKADRKPLKEYKPLVEDALKTLKDLVWQPDYYAALAYPEIMHALNLLGEADESKQMFETAFTVLKQTEEDIQNATGSSQGSPLGPAIFYLAESFMVRAQGSRGQENSGTPDSQATARSNTIKYLSNAAKLFYKVFEDYNQSAKAEDALAEVDKIKQVLDRYYDVQIEVGSKKQQIDVTMRTANENFREGRFSSAADSYLEAIRLDRHGNHVLDAAFFASSCYFRTNQFWRAMTMNDLLLEKFPDSEKTGNALYNTGIALFKEARELEQANAQGADQAMKLAVGYLTHYVEAAPTHPFAAATAYRIAESQYAKANELRQKVRELEAQNAAPQAINEAVSAAKEEFLQAVPLYQNVVDNHPASKNALLAYRKLGWIYQIIEEHELDAAKNFLAYSQNATDDIEGKIETKFMAADNLMRGDDPQGAITHFNELVSWTSKEGEYADASNAAKYRVAAEALLPWAYDQQAQQLREQLPRLETMLAEARQAPDQADEKKEGTAGENNMGAIDTSMNVEEIQARIESVKQEAKAFQDKALEGLIAEVKEKPKADETPANMAKIGSIYGQRGDFENAAKWLGQLDQEYPDTPAGQQALFTLFRSYINTGDKEKAQQVAQRMTSRLKDYSINSVLFIATQLFERDEKMQETVLDPELALAANREIIRRASDPRNPDRERLQNALQRAAFFEAKSLYLNGKYQEAVTKATDFLETYERSAYLFDVMLLRGRAHRELNDPGAALQDFQRVLGFIDQNEFKGTYYEAVVEAARTLNASEQIGRVKQAVQRVKPALDFAEADNEELQPWIEAMYFQLATSFALLGEMEKASEYQNQYLQRFVRGSYRQDIVALPAPRF